MMQSILIFLCLVSQGYGGNSPTMVRKRAAQDSVPENKSIDAEQHAISRVDDAIADEEESIIAASTDSDGAINPSLREGSFDADGAGSDFENQDGATAVVSDLEDKRKKKGTKYKK